MSKLIRETMENPRERIYKNYKREFDSKLQDLEKEKVKLLRKKKNRKEKKKQLSYIKAAKIKIMCVCV